MTTTLLTMLAKAPANRIATASAFVARLREAQDTERQRATPPALRIDSATVKRWLVPVLVGLLVVMMFVCGVTVGPKVWEMLSPTHTPESATSTPNLSGAEPPVCAKAGDIWIRPTDRMTLVCVPAGTFQMGYETSDFDGKPVHQVTLSAFWIDQTEVTNAQYRKCVEAGECIAPTTCQWGAPTYNDIDKVTHPAVCIDWQGAVDYCTWAGTQLPTEAQWEYTARGSEGYVFPWGNDWREKVANCTESYCKDGYAYTSPVGSFPEGKSWVGALDMAGNVWEWTADWYGAYSAESQTNPAGPATGEYRVVRGGSCGNDESYMRSLFRSRDTPSNKFINLGFRCVIVRVQD